MGIGAIVKTRYLYAGSTVNLTESKNSDWVASEFFALVLLLLTQIPFF